MAGLPRKPISKRRRIHATDEVWERIKARSSDEGYRTVSEFIMACAAASDAESASRDRSRRERFKFVRGIAEDCRGQLARPFRNPDMTSVMAGEAGEFTLREITHEMRGMSRTKWRHLGRGHGG